MWAKEKIQYICNKLNIKSSDILIKRKDNNISYELFISTALSSRNNTDLAEHLNIPHETFKKLKSLKVFNKPSKVYWKNYFISILPEPRKIKAKKLSQSEYNAKYYQENIGKFRAKSAKYKAAKLQRTPTWADLEKIEEIYKKCPDGYHVDHIVPLQGTNVSGLHVETNLQYLKAEENLKKSNSFEVS